MKKIALHWQILIAIVLSVPFGIFFYEYAPSIKWIGDIFIRALKMIAIPIVFSSLVMGVSSLGGYKDLGRLAGKTFAFYVFTTALAATIGIVAVNILKPGIGADLNLSESVDDLAVTSLSFTDQIVSIVPDNIFADLSKGNFLPVIFFAILFGFFITKATDKHKVILSDFFDAAFEVFMKMTLTIVKFTPYGVFAIVSNIVADQQGDPEKLYSIVSSLGLYTLVVWGGCIIHAGLVLPGLVYGFTRLNPYKHIKQMSVPLLTAFSTCSSGATLPLTIRDSQEKTGISTKITSFVLPLGSTINMNGTALYEGVTAIFIAQAYGIDLSVGQQFVIVLTSVLASVGAAGIPMAGLVMIAVVLGAVGLPLEGIGLILAVQQLCDMIRTSVNVYGDTCAAVVVAHSEGEKLNL
ncbi:MAG: dicarboxylate/amino acid:cation symporter [Bacteroidales bacterium]|jgi:Na+/H+-dicarboxylate symporter|nr:dicarboxylate/amino acid:cation symporter [Bacteroidales bacterium]MDD3299899.1 dicarboxylate/amino acid:cation symporter [Bacteroidales bacterium]MDD4618784.1 dicarboxylate/amino acid:cation symporter [Bacteroidales bacterium]